MDTKIIEKFWKNVEKTDTCWLWTGPISKNKRVPIIHKSWTHGATSPRKVSYYIHRGTIDIPHYLYLSCGNNLCVNPDHIFEKTQEDLFWEKVSKTDSCWVWTGGKSNFGHGLFTTQTDGKSFTYQAHRYAYALANGPIPDGLIACHRCDNASCVNPGHIFLGTPKDNSQDRDQKERRYTKVLSDEVEADIVSQCNLYAMAVKYDVDIYTITSIIHRHLLKKETTGT